MIEYMFKIRFPDGQYSTGGMDPKRSKTGKIWRGVGPFHSHLQQVKVYAGLSIYKGCVVETYKTERYENPAIGLMITSPSDWYEKRDFIKQVFKKDKQKHENK